MLKLKNLSLKNVEITDARQQTIKGGNSNHLTKDSLEKLFPRPGNLGNCVVPGHPFFRKFWKSKYGME